MENFFKNMSPTAELITVITAAFGLSILWSVLGFVNMFFGSPVQYALFTDASLIETMIMEIIIFAFITSFLKTRNNPLNFSNNAKLRNVLGMSLIILIAYYVFYYSMIFAITALYPNTFASSMTISAGQNKLSLIVILLMSIINPVFEESIVIGYIVPALQSRKGVFFALNISVLIRVLYHLYQGPIAIISIVPMGILFVYVYKKWNNIWPLIIAHGIMDFIAFFALSRYS